MPRFKMSRRNRERKGDRQAGTRGGRERACMRGGVASWPHGSAAYMEPYNELPAPF
jgi:hypothetical protein